MSEKMNYSFSPLYLVLQRFLFIHICLKLFHGSDEIQLYYVVRWHASQNMQFSQKKFGHFINGIEKKHLHGLAMHINKKF